MTHGRTLCVATDWVAMTGLGAGDRYLMVNPFFHMFGLKAGHPRLGRRRRRRCSPSRCSTSTGRWPASPRSGSRCCPAPPTLYQSILDHPDRDRHDLSSLRVAVTGAADIPVELIRRIVDELPFPTVVIGLRAHRGRHGQRHGARRRPRDDRHHGRPGRARASRSASSATRARDLPAGETGEILLRGPSVMAGYLDDPDATAEALSPDGWLRTGDLGVLDDGGCLRIVGRSKDMFIVGGFNAYPAEIENHLLRHPDVQQAAVIGIPDERLGEVGMAFVVTRSGRRRPSAPRSSPGAATQIANYKVPRAIEIVDELPLNATGKVEKNVLRERAAQSRPVSTP